MAPNWRRNFDELSGTGLAVLGSSLISGVSGDPEMSDPTSSPFGIHAAALSLREQRLQLLASNMANADTPNYKARDIDFESALKQAIGEQVPGTPLKTDPAHLGGSPKVAEDGLVYRVPTQPSLDGNTVDAEYEKAAFARAALEYRASLSFIDGRVRKLMTAITGS
jgi:flagellar basal-body rod protein FlgB